MSHLSHPNTARVFLYGQLEDGACYFVMEHLEGHNLAQEVRRNGPMDVARALKIMAPVAGALEEAHQAGIIHRDLKPENIFLTTQGGITDYPKVLDFGLAKVSEKQMAPGSMMLTREGMVFGTPEFMSPEQAQGQKLDGRSDIYSLGVILYELLTGKLPFEAKHSMEFIKHQVATAPIPISARVPGLSFPRAVEAIIERALAKKPSQRFATAAEMAAALQEALDNQHLWEEERRSGPGFSASGDRASELPTYVEASGEAVIDDDPLPGVPVGWIVAGLAVAIGVIGGLIFWIG